MADAPFLTLAQEAEAEMRVRGSRFLALAAPVRSEEVARDLLRSRERAYFDATHNCAAWRLRDGTWRTIDAGEPSGSAGAPILAAIEAEALLDAAVIVTRYFGGTKLGVGGLVRAYGEAAASALAAATKWSGVPARVLSIRYPYVHTAAVMRTIERLPTHRVEHGFAADGDAATVTFTLPVADEDRFRDLLRESTAGAVAAEVLQEDVLYLPVRG